jgi:hypothetical protein
VLKLLKKSVPTHHKEYHNAKALFEKFRTRQNVDELVRLYTLETPLYKELQSNVDSFAIELYSYLSSLQERAFKGGQTHRGLTMSDDSIKAYRWAAKDKGRMIEIKTMTSTTIDESVAIKFAEEKKEEEKDDNKYCVLCILEFPDVCYTAIDLNIGEPITKYAYEKEILLLPGTLFEVRTVTNGPKDGWYTIRLENVPVPHKILMKALNELKTA